MQITCPECLTENSHVAMFCKNCGCGFEAELTSKSHELCSFSRRAVAFILDQNIIGLIYLLLAVLLGFSETFSSIIFTDSISEEADFYSLINEASSLSSFVIFGAIATATVGWLYYAVFESSSLMATPGKLVLGIKVQSDTGDKLNFYQATIRYFMKVAHMILCSFASVLGSGYGTIAYFAWYFTPLFTKFNQAPHDFAAESIVVRTGSN